MAEESEEGYWNVSGGNQFDFEDEHLEILPVNVEKIETEKQRISSKSAAVSYQVVNKPTVVLNSEHFSNISQFKETVPDETGQIEISISPAMAIRNLVMGKPHIFQQFKGLTQKKELLNEAIRWYDGNAIMAVLIFLQKTLSASLFHKLILDKPIALNHYLKHLKVHREFTKLNDILEMLGKTEDALMFSYKAITTHSHPETKLNKLRKFRDTHLSRVEFLGPSIQEQITLLECQLPIEDADAMHEKDGRNLIFQSVPRPKLPNSSVIDTLYYCCLYHFYLEENQFASPLFIRKVHQLTEKQFVWTALRAFTRLELWKDIDKLFQSKSWLGTNKVKTVIGFDKVVTMLHRANAPLEMISRYMALIESTERRLELAKKFKYYHIAIDTLVAMRDRFALDCYRQELLPNSREYLYALESLKSSSIKWKN